MTQGSNENWLVLLIDDDEDDFILARSMLSQARGRQIELAWAPSYEKGQELIQANHYDAALVDYDLGPRNGIQLIREVTQRGYPAPLILYTGRGSYDVDVEAMEAGATLYLTKSEANPLLLERAIRYAIERNRIEKELQEKTQLLEKARTDAENEKRQLEAVMEALPVGVTITDAMGGIVKANQEFEQVWGSPPPETKSITDYHAYQAWQVDSGEAVAPEQWASAQAVQKGIPVTGQVFKIQRFNGTQAFVLNSASPVRDFSGKIVGSAVAIQDITKLIEAEEAYRLSEVQLKSRNEALREANITLQEQAEELEVQAEELRAQTEELFETNQKLRENEANLRQISEQKAILIEAAAQLLAGADPLDRLDDFFQRFSESLGLEVYVQYNVSKEGGDHLELGRLRGFPERYHKVLSRLEFGQAVCGTVAQTRRPMYVNDVQSSKDRKTRLIRSMDIQTYACHPLIVEGRLLGTLSFGSRSRTRFDPQSIDLLRTFCNLVAHAMARKQMEVEFHKTNEDLYESEERLRESERQQRELAQSLELDRSRLAAVLENLPVGVWIADRDGRGLSKNEQVGRIWAGDAPLLESIDEYVQYQSWYADSGQQLAPEDYPMARVVRTHQPVEPIELRIRRFDGTQGTVLVTAAPIKDQEGRFTGVVAINMDISDRIKAEQAQREYAEELERSNAVLQDFAFIASHDLKEPLHKVRAFGLLLEQNYSPWLDEQGQDYIQRMKSASERMEKMLDGLLDYSRVTIQGKAYEKIDLRSLIKNVLSDLEVRIEETGGQVEVGGLPEIEGDRIQIRQLFQNLIGNALKFHQPDVPPLVKVYSKPTSGECIELFVEDNGIGFDMNQRDGLFQPFNRLVGKSEYEGSGMGLAICRKIVERHNGTITAESTPGKGSVFSVKLPISQH